MSLEKTLKQYRITRTEYERMRKLLKREPLGIEWAIFSALWSEHCSYKSSKVHLKKLFRSSQNVLQSEGENAGVIDLGQGERIAFKMESHNHPSFIEPFQGAATGVGGILRDIFTMGARPIFLANYLCFGEPTAPRMASLVDGVVRGISSYGNCVGVPNITGQTEFHSSYNTNILVNAFALGLFRPNEPIVLSKPKGVGNYVVYVGAKTGRDGVHGASMASESFDESSDRKRPTVQIGDPFFEKLLIESCLSVIKKNLVVAIQDMGAAGLTSSSFEMSAKAGLGFEMDLSEVPLRDNTLAPEDILLSESQERMLLICEPKNFDLLKSEFEYWSLEAKVIGRVREAPEIRIKWKNEILTEIDPSLIVDHAPIYAREFNLYKSLNRVECSADIELKKIDAQSDIKGILESEQGTSRKWIYRQYDQRVGARTVADCSESVGIVRLPDSKRGLATVLGCRPYLMRFDAEVGGADSVSFPAIELAAKGFESIGVTDCLNFGNPEKTEIMSEFVASLRSMSDQCEALNLPIISGNVSFYNETENSNITSTPATGVVGLRDTVDNIPKNHFTAVGLTVFSLKLPLVTTGGAYEELYSRSVHGSGTLDFVKIAGFVKLVRELVNQARPESTRVVGKFGPAYALARMCTEQIGVKIDEGVFHSSRELFLETLYDVLIVTSEPQKTTSAFSKLNGDRDVTFTRMGESSRDFQIGKMIKLTCDEVLACYESGRFFEKLA